MSGTITWISSRSDISEDDEAPFPSVPSRTEAHRTEALPPTPYPGPAPRGRTFGVASMMNRHLGPGSGPPTGPPPTKPPDDKQRLKAIRNDLLVARIDMIDQRQSHQRLRNWERHAREKLMKQLSTIDLPTSVRNTFGELQHVGAQLNQEDDRTKALEKRLTSLEYRLDRELDQQEARIDKSLESLVPHHRDSGCSSDDRKDVENKDLISSSSEGEPACLRDFKDKRADIPILQERLNNLEIDYGEERTARETRTNLGQPMSLPDIDFYDEYNQQRHFLRQGLLKTEAEVEELRRQCVTAGLMSEPNESKAESRTMYPSSDVRSARDGPPRYWYRLPYSEVNTVIKSSMALLSTRARVNEWLNQVLRVTGIELILSQHQPDEPNDMSTSLNTLAEWEEIDESEVRSFPSGDPLRTLDRFSWPTVHQRRVHRRHSDSVLFRAAPKMPVGWSSAHSR